MWLLACVLCRHWALSAMTAQGALGTSPCVSFVIIVFHLDAYRAMSYITMYFVAKTATTVCKIEVVGAG